MKKFQIIILTLCLVAAMTGCNKNSEKKEKDSSSESSHSYSELENKETSSSVLENKETSSAEPTTQATSQNTTEESTTETSNPQKEVKLLDIDKHVIHESVSSIEYAETLTEMNCLTASLGKNAAKLYPDLASAINNISDFYEVNILEQNDMFAETAEEALSSGEENFETYIFNLDVHIRRADSVAISILHDSYNYFGIDSESRSFWGENFNTETGETIYLPDVVTDIDKLAEAVETELYKSFGADTFYSDTAIENYFKDYGTDGSHWTLEYNGVTIYFDDGEIAGSGVGDISVTIEFEKYPELFKEKYKNTPDGYIVGLPMKSSFYTDLDGDGSSEAITLSDSYEGEFGVDRTLSLHISTPETDYTEKFMANGCEAYYIKTSDGKNYLYVLMELEAQHELYTFQITDTSINKVGKQPISPHYSNQTLSVLTDPDNMHFDVFGTIDIEPVGDDFFIVGDDGMPVMK
ncbi:MAG: DUF3298 domain-containing protein [Ruminococcus sp.]|nr:DUF3298 domain-containing protein [Ruminococcus sp.]